jgi:hypothetical protein
MFEVQRQPGAPEMSTPQMIFIQKALELYYKAAKYRCVYLTAVADLPPNAFEIHAWYFPSFASSQVFAESLAFSLNQEIKNNPQSPGGRVSIGVYSLHFRVMWSIDETGKICFDARGKL